MLRTGVLPRHQYHHCRPLCHLHPDELLPQLYKTNETNVWIEIQLFILLVVLYAVFVWSASVFDTSVAYFHSFLSTRAQLHSKHDQKNNDRHGNECKNEECMELYLKSMYYIYAITSKYVSNRRWDHDVLMR